MPSSLSHYSKFLFATIVILYGAEAELATDWAFEDSMQAIVDQINEGSGQAFSDALDVEALLDRVFEGLEVGAAATGLRRKYRTLRHESKGAI